MQIRPFTTESSSPPLQPSIPDAAVLQPGQHADYKLAGVIGEQLAEPLAAMRETMEVIEQNRAVSSSQMRLLQAAVNEAFNVARQSQQIARLATGRLRQSHERTKLDEVLRDLLLARAPAFQKAGIELHQNLKPVEIIIDPSLLTSLVEAALDWAVSLGNRLMVTLDIKNWPEHGMLQISASDSIAAGTVDRPSATGENLSWFLLSETARVMSVPVEKQCSSQGISVLLEFSRTVKRLKGMTAVEMDTGFDSLHGESRPMPGLRLLVITNDEMLRMEVLSISRKLSLIVDFAPSTSQGMRYCELDPPHMVVIDERIRDDVFDELMTALRRTDPNYPFVEIADQSNTLEVAGWMSDSMTRLSRDALRTQLPSILVLELAKVM